MLAGLMLSDPAATVLNVLVDEYLQSATPVASDGIALSIGKKIRFATVRNSMARLTEDGYISRPHVSSGGVPSDLGYRYYVESLPDMASLPTELQETVDRDLIQTEPGIGAWSKLCPASLSGVMENLVIATAPRAQVPGLKRIQLVFLRESTALLVLVLEEARLIIKILRFRDSVNQDQLDQAASRLNRSFIGLNWSQMQSNHSDLNPLEEQIKADSISLTPAVETSDDQEHYTDGVRFLMSQPEFSKGELIRSLGQLVEEKALLERVLNGAKKSASPAVFIGFENRDEFLNLFLVIICQYGVPQRANSTICVIGPKRMGYATALGGVLHLPALMGQMVYGTQGNSAY